MNRGGVPIARIAGIRISADWSVLLIGALLAWGVAGIVPGQAPGTSLWLAWIVGLIAAALLIGSMVAHELGHALLARRRGIAVDGIRLWLFGGIAQINGDQMTGRTEMLVAAVGPAITLVLAGAFFGSSWLLVQIGAPPLVLVVTEWLAAVNLALLLFNLIPAFPLDGGRILRGFLWTRSKNRTTATVAAARAGRFFALIVIGLGVLDLFFLDPVGGVWLMLIGWFLDSAARGEATGEQARHALEGVLVGDVMSKNPVIVPSWITVELLVDQYVMGHEFTSFPTHAIDGRIDGLVTMRGIKQVPPQQRGNRRAVDIAIPVDRVPIARPDEPVTDLLKRMGPASDGRAMVYEGGTLVGIVSPSDIARLLQGGPGRVPARVAA
ncbi:MAG TPA: site-2 protease family protein [Candidatus Saccharimonadales bacterium]|nr:site-2 protease family protein [Candidatus Saccharimonadales bacterium]